jgi:RNA polymerase sigma-70 factor (ECF subfamily)
MATGHESELLPRLKQGEPKAYEELVRTYSARLLSCAMRILGNAEDARDAVQETLISAWKKIHQFEGTASLYTWLHRIAVNACLARLRSTRSKNEIPLADDERVLVSGMEARPITGSESGPDLEKRTAMRHAIQRALNKIPEEFRVVLLLRDVEELSSKETAEQLGVTDALVRQRLHRARTIMAEMLRPELCAGPGLTCGGRMDLLLDYIDNALPGDLQQPVHDHIHGCPACSNLVSTYRSTIGVPRAMVELIRINQVDEGFILNVVATVAAGQR